MKPTTLPLIGLALSVRIHTQPDIMFDDFVSIASSFLNLEPFQMV